MIRCDVEGVTGVVDPAQASPDSPEYGYGLDMLHADVNAVVDGLLATGNHQLWIYDMHCAGRNLNMTRLDHRVRVICGKPPYAHGNAGGLTTGFDGLLLIGLHSKAGSGALLAHSYEHAVRDIRLNGASVGEIGLEAAVAGELGVPVLLVSGDSAGCAEARTLLGDIPTVAVKESLGPRAGLCYPAAQTAYWLQEAVRDAVKARSTIRPYTVAVPCTLEIDLENGPFADHVRRQLAEAVMPKGTLRLIGPSVAAAWAMYLHAKPQEGALTSVPLSTA
jgi:D-amino peptidase